MQEYRVYIITMQVI